MGSQKVEVFLSSLLKEEHSLFPQVSWKFNYGTAGFRDK